MTKRWRPADSRPSMEPADSRLHNWSAFGERGQATFSLLIVVAVVAVAVILLQRTAWHAEHINDKAGVIATTGGGINTATQAVLKLGRTNELAASILETAKPLEGKLDEIVRLAKSVDGLATSINDSAGTHQRHGPGDQRHRRHDPQHRPVDQRRRGSDQRQPRRHPPPGQHDQDRHRQHPDRRPRR